MRKLDVKEIHGYNNARGLKLIKVSAMPAAQSGGKSTPARGKAKETRNRPPSPSKGKPAANVETREATSSG